MRGGPGFIVAAAFVGPGTVTAATLAGAGFGMQLLWVLLFATLAAILLQEMSARLGLVTRRGLIEALSDLAAPWGRRLAWVAGLAVVVGVIAFEAGNLTGAALGLAAATGIETPWWIGAVACLAGGILWFGHYGALERALTAGVAVMGVLFVATAILVGPDFVTLLRGAVIPSVPAGGAVVVLALIGTTLVPYNLFLHARSVQARWPGAGDLRAARRDLVLGITAGGVVSASIMVTAAAAGSGGVESAADMARQLEPLLGARARAAFGLGLAVAGITSAITAPFAAACIVGELTGRPLLRDTPARTVALGCVAVGAAIALAGVRPVPLIVFAQAANGVILPLVATALIIALNNRAILGRFANGRIFNLGGAVVVALCALLAARNLLA